MLRPETPLRLAEVLASCLAGEPTARPSAGAAAVEVFDAAPAESVALAPVSDPAAEITRRIRAAAVSVAAPASPSRSGYRNTLTVGVLALLVAGVSGAWFAWSLHRPPMAAAPVALRVATQQSPPPTTLRASQPTRLEAAQGVPPKVSVQKKVPRSSNDVVTAPDSPRVAAAGLLQALVDARALAYVARSPVLLDLVYVPGAAQADADEANIATALKYGGTYLGLSYVIKDAAFLDGASGTARVRATILTPAYQTGQPDGRKIPHAQEILGRCVFTLSLTPDGWRILGVTVPGSR